MKTIITAIAITLILVGAACGQSGSGADSAAANIPVVTTSHSGSNIPVIDGVSRKLQSERKAFMMKDPGPPQPPMFVPPLSSCPSKPRVPLWD